MTRRKNPAAAAVPVLLMNPERPPMARRKTTRTRRAPARRAPARRAAPRRRATRRAAPRRATRRRRRNPSFKVGETLMGAAAGLAMGAGGYALSKQNITPTMAALALAGIGLVAGAAASGWKPSVGAGIAGGGAALAAGIGLEQYWAKKSQDTAGLGAMRQRYALAQQRQATRYPQGYPQMGAVRAPVSRRYELQMGAVRAPIAPGLQAQLNGLG